MLRSSPPGAPPGSTSSKHSSTNNDKAARARVRAATVTSMDRDLLEQTLTELGQPPYRAKQVWEHACAGAGSYEEMSSLPKSLRSELTERVPFSTLSLEQQFEARDGTVKALFRTHDEHPVESVLMRYRDGRRSVCISSQSGCPLKCAFCASGQMGFRRNLSAWEIFDQALYFRHIEQVNHGALMGMGEPLMNLEAVLTAIRAFPELGIGHRHTSVSTAGWVPGIDKLAAEDLPVRLALSLHAPDDELREKLMPVTARFPIAEVIAACEHFYARRRRKVLVEYLMLAGVNDHPEQARALVHLLDPGRFKLNLIPYNEADNGRGDGRGAFSGSSRAVIYSFRQTLAKAGLEATVRVARGREIDAACGQLAGAAGTAART
ncbi:MAG: 23S rRNA (adenine(2503)-C(2))-methyltransferase RlmN [Gaiellaceae bacterium]